MAPAARVALGGRFALSLESVCGLRDGVVGRGAVETCDHCECREEERKHHLADDVLSGGELAPRHDDAMPAAKLYRGFCARRPGDGCSRNLNHDGCSSPFIQELKSRQVKSSTSTLFHHSIPKLNLVSERSAATGAHWSRKTPQIRRSQRGELDRGAEPSRRAIHKVVIACEECRSFSRCSFTRSHPARRPPHQPTFALRPSPTCNITAIRS